MSPAKHRAQLVARARAAALALRARPDDEALGGELDAALAALHEFDGRHPELAKVEPVLTEE